MYQRNNWKRKYQYVLKHIATENIMLRYGDVPFDELDSNGWMVWLKLNYVLLHEVRLRK